MCNTACCTDNSKINAAQIQSCACPPSGLLCVSWPPSGIQVSPAGPLNTLTSLAQILLGHVVSIASHEEPTASKECVAHLFRPLCSCLCKSQFIKADICTSEQTPFFFFSPLKLPQNVTGEIKVWYLLSNR